MPGGCCADLIARTASRRGACCVLTRVWPLLLAQLGRLLWAGISSHSRAAQGAGSTSGLPESAWQAASNGTSSSTAATAAQAAMAAAGAGSHYETLGVAPSAGGGEIRRAYWRQATLTHPDKGGSDDAFAQARSMRGRRRCPLPWLMH